MKRKIYSTRLYVGNKKKRIKEMAYLSISKGDETEKFVSEIIKSFGNIEDVKIIGNTGSMYDIIYKYKDDNYRAIQVKTLIKDNYSDDTWRVKINQTYLHDTLIVLVNENRTRFGLISYCNVNTTTLSLGFKKLNKGKYRHCKYNDLTKFSTSLNRRSKQSSIYNVEDSFSDSIKKEYNSLLRLEEKCGENNIEFVRNNTNSTSIDCYINKFSAQCKYSSLLEGKKKLYSKFNLHRSNGSINGIHQTKPYSEYDLIDYFIFEIGGPKTDCNKYNGYFCIIPIKILIERGYISNRENNNGKKSISLCPPDYTEQHWCLQYWNNYNL
jgi:hypothetical protein